MRCICGCSRVDCQRLLVLDQNHFLLWYVDCYLPAVFSSTLWLSLEAGGARRWIVSCPWLQGAEILFNLPCNISEATVKLQLYVIDINPSWWMHSFLAASRSQQLDCGLTINFLQMLLSFHFLLQISLICLVNQYSEIFPKEKTLKNEVSNFYIIIH